MDSFKNSTTYTHESELWPDEVISDIHTDEEFKDFSFSASSVASLELLVKKIHNFCFMCFHSRFFFSGISVQNIIEFWPLTNDLNKRGVDPCRHIIFFLAKAHNALIHRYKPSLRIREFSKVFQTNKAMTESPHCIQITNLINSPFLAISIAHSVCVSFC